MEDNSNTLDIGSIGSIDFTPAWARKNAGVTTGKIRPERAESERKPIGERKPFDGKGSSGMRDRGGSRKPFGDRHPRFEERERPLDAEVRILPEPKALGQIIRRIQGDAHAYKLKRLAYFLLDNPQAVLLKVTPRNDTVFYQCKACGFVSTKQEDVIAHAIGSHLTDYYDAREVACEPPKGNFNCVAKCGLSGVLLGPPNIHEFNGIVREMIRTRYPDMSEEQYRAHIVMLREAEAIEAWRQSATQRTVFTPKNAAGGEAGEIQLTREQAEGEFKRAILPSMLNCPKHLMITADVAERSPVRSLVLAVRDAIEAERRAPYNMIFALRGAFHHRKFNFFRVNDSHGQEFVTAMTLKAFDAEHAVPELAEVARFVADHPCCAKADFAADPEKEKHLDWLVSTGHVIAFTNGVFSAVEKYPKYGPQWRKNAETGGERGPEEAVAASEKEPEVPMENVEKVEETRDESSAQLAE